MSETAKLANRVGLTPRRTLLRIKQGLDATDQKASYDKDRGKWVYSDPLVAWGARKDYAALAVTVLDMKPSEKVVFPDKDGNPQNIAASFGDTERSARLLYLLEQAEKRMKDANGDGN